MENSNNLGGKIVPALIHFFHMLAFILFICPFAFWKAATIRMAQERENKSLTTFATASKWPFLSFCKKIFFGFIIDGSIFISYFVGILVAIITLFAGGGFLGFLGVLIAVYYLPLFFSIIRDTVYVSLLQFTKFLSWVAKPAQQLDIDVHNHDAYVLKNQ